MMEPLQTVWFCTTCNTVVNERIMDCKCVTWEKPYDAPDHHLFALLPIER